MVICPLIQKEQETTVVNELAKKVYAIQLLDSRHACSQIDGYGSKYGYIKTIVADAKKIYPWVDQTKIYNCLKTTKRGKSQGKGGQKRHTRSLGRRMYCGHPKSIRRLP
jgi:hypothetical protein